MPGPQDKNEPLRTGEDFDTTAELWDRLGEDLANLGRPCLETVERLVDEACRRPTGPAAKDSAGK